MTLEITPEDMLCLEKDKHGFIHIKLYRNGANGIDTITMTKYPVTLPVLHELSRNVVFLREKYITLLQEAGVITQSFKTNEGYWCGFIHIDVFFQLETQSVYTQRLMYH